MEGKRHPFRGGYFIASKRTARMVIVLRAAVIRDRGGESFCQINDEFVILIGQQCIPETVLLRDGCIGWIKVQVEALGGRRSHGIAPIINHPISRNTINHLPIPQNEMQLCPMDIDPTSRNEALDRRSRPVSYTHLRAHE